MTRIGFCFGDCKGRQKGLVILTIQFHWRLVRGSDEGRLYLGCRMFVERREGLNGYPAGGFSR